MTVFDTYFISTKDLKKYFNKKGYTIKTKTGGILLLGDVLDQYETEETLKTIRRILIQNIKDEIKVAKHCEEMTTDALAEHIIDKLLSNLDFFEIYIQSKKEDLFDK